MDNLRVHHAKIVMEAYPQNIQPLFLPPYSCALNPIERLWAIVKNRFRSHQTRVAHEPDTPTTTIEETLERIFIELEPQMVKNVARSHYRSLHRSILGHLV
jgi:transposase